MLISSRFLHTGIGAGLVFEFDESASEGATLFLPDGVSRKELRNMGKFRTYAMKHGVEWYKHAVGRFGREPGNGSIILVTGCDKTISWGIASFKTESTNKAVTLNFKATEIVQGTASFTYHWVASIPASIRVGPLRFDGSQAHLVANREYVNQIIVDNDTQNPGHNVQFRSSEGGPPQFRSHNQPVQMENQCVFIRGYSISIKESFWQGLFGHDGFAVELVKMQGSGYNSGGSSVNLPRSINQTQSHSGRWPNDVGYGMGQQLATSFSPVQVDTNTDSCHVAPSVLQTSGQSKVLPSKRKLCSVHLSL